MSVIDELYKSYEKLSNNKTDILKDANEYVKIVKAANGESSEKKLACQFIPHFFKYFPDLMNDALNAYLDMCEDQDSIIRRLAIKGLPEFCRDLPGVVARISAILTQMLAIDDSFEFSLIQASLLSLLNTNSQNCIDGILAQITVDEIDPTIRSKALQFLYKHISSNKVSINPTTCEVIKNNLLNVISLQSLEVDQFKLCLDILNISLKDQNLRKTITDTFIKLISHIFTPVCIKLCQPLIPEHAHKFNIIVSYSKTFNTDSLFYENVVQSIFENCENLFEETLYPSMLRNGFSACRFVQNNIETLQELIYKVLMNKLPSPPKDLSPEEVESHLKSYQLNYDVFEPIILCFAVLYSKNPAFHEWNVKDSQNVVQFREKIQFFIRIMQVNDNLTVSKPASSHPRIKAPGEENVDKRTGPIFKGPKSSIYSTIKNFLLNPPNSRISVTPSWSTQTVIKPAPQQPNYPINSKHKRIVPATDNKPTKIRISSELYIPPSARTAAPNNNETTKQHATIVPPTEKE